MNGFGFIEYEDAMDARDIVPAFHGSDFKGERLTVQFARGPRHKETFAGPPDRNTAPRPRRTVYRMQITGLQPETSWQDLKDFARQSGLDVVYSETGRERDGKGFVEFETGTDLKTAVEKLDGHEFKGGTVTCAADIQEEKSDNKSYRQRSPQRGRYGHPNGHDEYRRPPPRGFSPRGYGRERSPGRGPPPDSYYRDYPPRRTPPPRDPYGAPPARRYEHDPYDRAPPPARGAYGDPYRNGDPYARPRSPPRSGYGYGGGYGGYDDRRY